jgi:Asp-tRNA(Asn)/Glu-tRNA(Gln) amidotransferase A subunit family amidase
LTRLYLDRIRRYDPVLKCVITRTDELALELASRADREIASGMYRGPLHGIPWGAKDLLAVPGYATTWGAGPYRDQVRPEKARVASRLEDAGAVLVAKTTVGELAWGDVWFGGTTKNPWNTKQGSSGSSAGSASATAAGLVGFSIGTETWGSIISPCTRCGTTGLRPTFGRVSRYGAMALAWSMDKIGPIARSAEDCALVFGSIHGADPLDPTSVDRAFEWPPTRELRKLRIGFLEDLFEGDYTKWAEKEEEKPGLVEWKALDRKTLQVLRDLGLQLVPVKLPDSLPVGSLATILTAEAAAAFDELTRSGRDAQLVRQVADAWPNVFRQGQMVPAVEYIRANRIRVLAMRAMDDLMAQVDVYVAPTFGGDNLLLTNLTGHPAVVVPNGFRSSGSPTSITFQGRLYGESTLLAVAHAYQQATDFHLRRPKLVHESRS